jgi:hypothetical protein
VELEIWVRPLSLLLIFDGFGRNFTALCGISTVSVDSRKVESFIQPVNFIFMKRRFVRRRVFRFGLPILALLATLNAANSVLASGFALTEQSVPNLGNAGAGGPAAAEDASVIFFNPAGLTRLPGNSVVGAGYAVFPTVKFQNQGSTSVLGTPVLGSNGGDAGVNRFLPNFYTSWSLSDRELNQTVPGAGTVRGDVEGDVDVISAQVNWSF